MISFYLLARVCDEYFIESLDKIAKRLKMSSDAAGATLMAAGTSAPELFVVIIALLKPGGHEEIGTGTIVGSAIFNILVIVGASAVAKKMILPWQPFVRDMAFYALSIIMLAATFRDGEVRLGEAAVLAVFYAVYVITVIKWKGILPHKEVDAIEMEERVGTGIEIKLKKIIRPLDLALDRLFPSANRYYLVFFFSIVVIAILSWALVESAVTISYILHIPEAIIALTVLAAGTSVPDLISSIIVSRQGRGGMAVSNAIGSNIFNILFGLGVPWLMMLSISGGTIPVGTEIPLSSVMFLFATILIVFFLLLVRKWKIGLRGGYFLIGLYIMYLIWTISRL